MFTAHALGTITNRCLRDDGVTLWLRASESDSPLDDARAYVVPLAGESADPDLAKRAMLLPLFRTHVISYTVLRGVRVVTEITAEGLGTAGDVPLEPEVGHSTSRRTP
jgi:hypothetical protein